MAINPNELNRLAESVDSVNTQLPLIKSHARELDDAIRFHGQRSERGGVVIMSFLEAVSAGRVVENEADEEDLMVMIKETADVYGDYADHVESFNNELVRVTQRALDLQHLHSRVGEKLRRIRDTYQ